MWLGRVGQLEVVQGKARNAGNKEPYSVQCASVQVSLGNIGLGQPEPAIAGTLTRGVSYPKLRGLRPCPSPSGRVVVVVVWSPDRSRDPPNLFWL